MAAIKKQRLYERLGVQKCQFRDGKGKTCTRAANGTAAYVSAAAGKLLGNHQFCLECYRSVVIDGFAHRPEPSWMEVGVTRRGGKKFLTKPWVCATECGGNCPYIAKAGMQVQNIKTHYAYCHSTDMAARTESEDAIDDESNDESD